MHSKYYLYIICRLFLLLIIVNYLISCQKQSEFQILAFHKQYLTESKDLPIKKLPQYLISVNDSFISFQNGEKSIFIYSINTGKLSHNIFSNIDIEKLFVEDSSDTYDLNKHPNVFLRNYPRYRIVAFDYSKDIYYLYYYRLKPKIVNRNLSLFNKPFIIEVSINNKVKRITRIDKDYYEDKNLGFTPNHGFIFLSDSLFFYTYTSLYNIKFNKEIAVSKLVCNNDLFVFSNKISLTFPTSIYFENVNEKNNDEKRYGVYCQFFKFSDRIYILNGKDIYNLRTRELLFESIGYDNNDSIHRIKSFAMLPDRKDSSEVGYIAYIDEVIPEPLKFKNSNKYMVVHDYQSDKEVYRRYLGKDISGLALNDEYILVMKKEGEDVILMKFEYEY